jgi:hydroxyacylglutathione hydrolase
MQRLVTQNLLASAAVAVPELPVERRIEGSVNLPLNHLHEHIRDIPRNRRIAVHCAGGYRSSIAASLLHQYGLTNLIEMAGGLAGWESARLPVVSQA